ncbi:CAMK family protein kinase [Histomonas meleagridis]|uniref:CAMK family protein kinase n=1 Tax=Histomonas meleagridis TaxID=135588 RepID=UPI003559B961|nr:CAMK family protein kinase [Histomonas meleagridis]KAH0805450.1 CAMK family protein kinase [Histomonas meleagridis]
MEADLATPPFRAEIGPYVLSKTLGEGITSKVKLAFHKETGQQVAIKIISKSLFLENEELQLKVKREVALMRLVQHPNIMKLYDVLESKRHLYIILEYEEQGELFDYLVTNHFFQEDVAMELFRQIVLAVGYLHSLGICHRDLKPENILLDANKRIKLADFGFARWVRENMQTETSCGSPHYAAPEIIRGQPYDGRGYLPFDDSSIRNLLNKVKRGVYQMLNFSPDVQDLIRRMLTVDVTQRITLDEIVQHPAFRIGLMPSYIPPSPIPFPKFFRAIDVNNIPPAIIEILSQIGISGNDLYNDLQSTENNMTKVFVVMLTNQFIDLDQLPWECAYSGYPVPLINSTVNTPISISSDPSVSTSSNTLFRQNPKKPIQSQSLEMYSFAQASDFNIIRETNVNEYLDSYTINTAGISVWSIFGSIQLLLADKEVQWFHPDPLTMYIRTMDTLFYVSINAKFTTPSDVSLRLLLHKGDTEMFQSLGIQIEKTLTSLS